MRGKDNTYDQSKHTGSRQRATNQALIFALESRDWEEAERLLAEGADINAQVMRDGLAALPGEGVGGNKTGDPVTTPLLHALVGKDMPDIKAVRFQLDHGANVNSRDSSGHTPLIHLYGVFYDRGRNPKGHSQRVDEVHKLLIERGADINATTDKDSTALHYAVSGMWPLPKVCQILQDGADPNQSKTADMLHSAWRYREGKEVFDLLVEHGADVNATNRDGDTALSWMCRTAPVRPQGMVKITRSWVVEIARHMLAAGADVNRTKERGQNALYGGAHKWKLDLAQVLLEAGANPNQGKHEELPLYSAAVYPSRNRIRNEGDPYLEADEAQLIRLLLKHGADPNRTNVERRTILHEAVLKAEGEDSPVCEILIKEGGADVNAKDAHGKTPADYASELGAEENQRLMAGLSTARQATAQPPAPDPGMGM